jgi:cysteine-rich repeat protein
MREDLATKQPTRSRWGRWLGAVAPALLLLTQCNVDKARYQFDDHPENGGGGQTPGGGVSSPTVFNAVGDVCTENGLRVCAGAAQKQRLVCIDGAFEQDTPCSASENCDQLSGACLPVAAECVGKSLGFRLCDAAGKVKICSFDLVRVESEECSGTCKDGRCMASGCGDGVVTPPEQCDDGNAVNGDACSNSCVAAGCGDGVMQTGEECDDGNAVDSDSCVDCRLTRCGDGILAASEECDDGNTTDTDGCSNLCKLPKCGDQLLQAGETCDDGNAVDNDGCTNACRLPGCGDRIVQPGEACDDGNAVDTDDCSNACAVPGCGDGVVQAPREECDDGNLINTDGCTVACKKPKCGDSFLQPGEECDDGNTSNEDGCTNQCKTNKCGDGYRQSPKEQCDDGNIVNDDACSNVCQTPRCGDNITQMGEECDDGNAVNDDQCTVLCRRPVCGDGIIAGNENCEDGNKNDGDGCNSSCQAEVCGDGLRTGNEQCDDGNKVDNDGCSATCRKEVCGDGIVQRPREDCEDLNTVDTDVCRNGCKNAATLNALSNSCSTVAQITQTVCMAAVANWCKQYGNSTLAGMVTGQTADNEYTVGCVSGFTRQEVDTTLLQGQCPGGRQQSPGCLEQADAACQALGYTQGFYLGNGSSAGTTALACGNGTRTFTDNVPGCNGIGATDPVPVACAKALAAKCGNGRGGMMQLRAQTNQVTYTCVDLTLTGSVRLR